MAEAYWILLLASKPGVLGLYTPPLTCTTVNVEYYDETRVSAMTLITLIPEPVVPRMLLSVTAGMHSAVLRSTASAGTPAKPELRLPYSSCCPSQAFSLSATSCHLPHVSPGVFKFQCSTSAQRSTLEPCAKHVSI
jgi:hypothetical protein